MQALSDEHVELRGSLRAEVVAKEVVSRKLDRVTSNIGDTIIVRHHSTLSLLLSLSPVDFVSQWRLLSLFRFCLLPVCLVRMC